MARRGLGRPTFWSGSSPRAGDVSDFHPHIETESSSKVNWDRCLEVSACEI
jgi:hypothetical protein